MGQRWNDLARCLKDESVRVSMVLLGPVLVCFAAFRRAFERQDLWLRSHPGEGEEMKHVLIVLLCGAVGLLAGLLLSQAAISLFFPVTETFTVASDYIVLG